MPSEYGGNDLRLEWCPKGSAHGSPGLSPTWTKASCNVFFIFYLDCILIDRWLWHRTNWEAGAYEFSTNEVVWAYSRYAEE